MTSSLSLPASARPDTRGLFLPGRLVLFASATLICCAISGAGALRGPVAAVTAMLAISIAMAHGAYDHLQGQRLLAPRFGARWPLPFFSGYLLLGAITLLGWYFFPLPSLLLFLAYSSWHFGLEPEGRVPAGPRILAGFALGALPIVAACRWHTSEVAPIFARMLGPSASWAVPLTHALGSACRPAAAVALAGCAFGLLVRPLADRLELAAAAALQLVLFFVCGPLVAFAVFFCCWHTPEHLLATSLPAEAGSTLSRNLLGNLRAGFGPWLLSISALGAAFVFGRKGLAAHEGQLFILLSALTVPHMALDELRRFQKS